MENLLKKLNFKTQTEVFLQNVPIELANLTTAFAEKTEVSTDWGAIKELSFAMFFVMKQTEIDAVAEKLAQKLQNKQDVILWFVYPKKTSKKYVCDFNRDTGWDKLGALGFEAVRMVAIDENWSGLRFRHIDFINVMARSENLALSAMGKEKTKKG